MGLDWLPVVKPAPGREEDFDSLYQQLVFADDETDVNSIMREINKISISYMEELEIPVVGKDKEADEYLAEVHKQKGLDEPLADYLKRYDGFLVWELAKPCDGMPEYTHAFLYDGVDKSSFRAEFLKDTVQIIGRELFEQAHGFMIGGELLDYADQLEEEMISFCKRTNFDLDSMPKESTDDDSLEPNWSIGILQSAIKYCRFWGSRGYFIQPYC